MYAGHAGVALVLSARQPQIAIAPLMLACYGPDWVESSIRVLALPVNDVLFTHSIPAMVVGAVVAAALYRLAFRRSGARYIALAWLLHWPADFLTGTKPLIDARHMVGLQLYERPWADLALETVVIIAACSLYWRAFGTSAARRRTILLMGLGLVLAQAGLDYYFASRGGWGFVLAAPRTDSHVSRAERPGRGGTVRMVPARPVSTSTASDRCRRTIPQVS